MASTRQPSWSHPQSGTHEPGLKVYNSLTRSKKPFVPKEKGKISWYSCGPTVYDDAHLGHARNYVTTDVLRRILRDYFKFEVNFVMNITDVDDKIILAGRKRYLYKDYQAKHRYIDDEVRTDVLKAWRLFIAKRLPRLSTSDLSPVTFHDEVNKVYKDVLSGQALQPGIKPGDQEAKIKMYIRDAQKCAEALTMDSKTLTPIAFYELAKDPMCDMLDAALGSSIKGSDHHIFKELTEEYERRFFQDMNDLNVLQPDKLVRVTEYGPQIAKFVDTIVDHKFAYATEDGSVYFDIKAFEAAGNPYARLEPWNRGDTSLQADGEGALSQRAGGKRSDADFALWKASKPGEPSWPSQWGEGRPGWHIECSAMASDVLGKQMDIHSGGIDLAFPHHDNELAQSEAYWHCGKSTQWVNYFLHMGHLSIAGSKMSKSLKNFTTIRTALDKGDWTPRSLRIVFLLGNWRDGIEITDDLVKAGQSWEDRVDNFFINAKEAVDTIVKDQNSPVLEQALVTANSQIREALNDSFNTPEAMAAISRLITEYNSQTRTSLSYRDHRDIGVFITRMVNIFGLNGNGQPDTTEIGWEGIEISTEAKTYVEPLSKMRDQLRQAAIARSITKEQIEKIVSSVDAPKPESHSSTQRPRPSFARALTEFRDNILQASSSDNSTMNQEILKLCDQVRDVALWNLNVYLEDRENQPALVRPVTEGLRVARKEKEERARQKEEAKRKRDEEQRQKLAKGKLRPQDMFRPPQTDEFSAWDPEGLPTTLRDGSPVPSSRVKKLKKEWEKQKKAHDVFLQAVQDGTVNGKL
ncbi:cysteinyl-tRNA synthetase [Lithohypha guttulata]|uniref:cysteinyl-tRNA synthetase n=1 Tax=Lithohypha guttulata TaxID=1690604 RepID=UPI002DDF16A3|nr:cysteinyl-tRNA synthetase [Lithohypha guttulata]